MSGRATQEKDEGASRYVTAFLLPEDFRLLDGPARELSEEYGFRVEPPDPQHSCVAVVFDKETGRMVGCFGLVTVVHAEYLWLDKGERGKPEVLQLLIDKVQEPFEGSGAGFYCFIPDERMAHLAVKNGMKMLPWRVALKEFPAEAER